MTMIIFPEPAKAEQKPWLARPITWRNTPALILISLITLLSVGLHLYNLQSIGSSNAYFTASTI
jgi:type VI protein secretion system component VasK